MSRSLLFALAAATLFLVAACADAASDGEATGGKTSYADDMAEQHADDSTNASPAVRAPIVPVTAREVEYGAAAQGYFAEPERPDSVLEARGLDPSAANLPGLVVIHEWWGLNDNIEAMARRLAGEGYRVLAVDLYGGQVAESPETARDLMERAMQNRATAVENIGAARAYLASNYDSAEIGVMGWCFGGGMTLQAAVTLPRDFDAGVIYYGHVEDVERSELEQIDMPILGLFGAEDGGIPVEGVRAFESTLQDLGKPVEVHVYENAGHAFANPTGQNYVPEAAEQAWEQTTTFLRETLYDSSSDDATS